MDRIQQLTKTPFLLNRRVAGALAGLVLSCSALLAADTIVADFDGESYGDWKATGSAFGNRPAQGTLPNQMAVDGFQGPGLVNSFHGGDRATGRITSPTFRIERKYLQFLIGGGGWEGKTCMNLVVDGKVVRTATGPNTEPGGSERLQPGQWDVEEFAGKEATIEIVDDHTGGWGHINVDHIVLSDNRVSVATLLKDVTRDIDVRLAYVNFPVKNGAPKRRITVFVDGKEDHGFDIELADGDPDWWAFLDGNRYRGKTITLKVDKLPENSNGLKAIDQTSAIKNSETLYRERLRPQFHFTSRRGWLNDPNGLVFYEGEYHLFYQHNPYGWDWGNMHWGHAVSKDLVHWRELPVALYPDEHGTMYSGSTVVDWNNTAGFQTGKEPALVAMFTAAGRPFTQGLAFSNNRGRTWTKYEKNPVMGHIIAENRDPKVVWYAPENKWVMSLYLNRNDFSIFGSKDLKKWEKLSDFQLDGDSECPNFYQMPLNGNTNDQRWVFFGANGVYSVGNFDGRNFTPEGKPQRLQNGNCWYASQVFSDIPASDGRCILIPWGRLPDGEIFRGMPFNQVMGLPVELKLASSVSAPLMTAEPVRELETLRGRKRTIPPQLLEAISNPLAGIEGDLLEIQAQITTGTAKTITFDLRGVPLVYSVEAQEITCLGSRSKLKPRDGRITLQIYVDRRSVDIFGDEGSLYMPMATRIAPDNRTLKLSATAGTAKIEKLTVYDLKSIWR